MDNPKTGFELCGKKKLWKTKKELREVKLTEIFENIDSIEEANVKSYKIQYTLYDIIDIQIKKEIQINIEDEEKIQKMKWILMITIIFIRRLII